MKYPFCTLADVQAINTGRPAYNTTTSKPSSTNVYDFMDAISAQISSIVASSGYDVDNIHAISDTIALAIAAGSSKSVTVTDGTKFHAGDVLKFTGSATGVRKWEFANIVSVTGNVLVIDVLANSYDAGTVMVYLVNDAMRILRDLNAIGSASKAEEGAFMGSSPNKSEHAETLWEKYIGSEKTMGGLWAIQHVEDYLTGATQTTEALEKATIQSYGSEHYDDDDVQPTFTVGMDF